MNILSVHITLGTIGLIFGFIAALSKKGSLIHRVGGVGFLVFMGVSVLLGVSVAVLKPERITVIGGAYALYLMLTGWLSVKEKTKSMLISEHALIITGALICGCSIFFGFEAVFSSDGLRDGFPAEPYLFFGAMAFITFVTDMRWYGCDQIIVRQRLTRHLCRMCGAMLIVEASVFLGQSDAFPVSLQRIELLVTPLIIITIVMIGSMLRLGLQQRS